jgi:phosphate transport system permease protein
MEASRELASDEQRERADRRGRLRLTRDRAVRAGMAAAAVAVLLILAAVSGSLLLRSWPVIGGGGLGAMLAGASWQPMRGQFGFLPFVAGSAAVTAVAMLVAVPPAILSGIYLAEYASARSRNLLKPVVDLLAGVPPVIYGLWGVLVIVPFVRDHAAPWVDARLGGAVPWLQNSNPSGYGLFAAGLVLGAMVFPLIVAVVDEVLRAAPASLREALHALGATRWEATRVVVTRAALPGVIAAVVLGFSRAFGETLAVLMVVGNIPRIPGSLFDGATTLSGLIANNYGEMMSVPLYEAALMSAALLLLVVVVGFNIGARLVIRAVTRQG